MQYRPYLNKMLCMGCWNKLRALESVKENLRLAQQMLNRIKRFK